MLKLLLGCGRDVGLNAPNKSGRTVLHTAAKAGWQAGVDALLAGGAERSSTDLQGITAEDIAGPNIDMGFTAF